MSRISKLPTILVASRADVRATTRLQPWLLVQAVCFLGDRIHATGGFSDCDPLPMPWALDDIRRCRSEFYYDCLVPAAPLDGIAIADILALWTEEQLAAMIEHYRARPRIESWANLRAETEWRYGDVDLNEATTIPATKA